MNISSKHKYILAGIVGALVMLALVVGAIFAGPALVLAAARQGTPTPTASTEDKHPYCEMFEQNLAKELGITVEKLHEARQNAGNDVIDQMVKDGKLTQDKATKLKERLEKKSVRDCSYRPHRDNKGQDAYLFTLHKYSKDMLTQLAQGLKLNADQLQSQLKDGKSLSEIAKVQGISENDLNTLVKNTIDSTLKKAVSANDITQKNADGIRTFVENHPKFVDTILRKEFKVSGDRGK